ncbi:IPPc domain-containing protein [Psidium guajava]|nr:IPPc domain-containing protein [Psidium guajava]
MSPRLEPQHELELGTVVEVGVEQLGNESNGGGRGKFKVTRGLMVQVGAVLDSCGAIELIHTDSCSPQEFLKNLMRRSPKNKGSLKRNNSSLAINVKLSTASTRSSSLVGSQRKHCLLALIPIISRVRSFRESNQAECMFLMDVSTLLSSEIRELRLKFTRDP